MAITDPALQQAYSQRARAAGVPKEYEDFFLRGDPNDYHRIESTWNASGKDQWAQDAAGKWSLRPEFDKPMDPTALANQRAQGYGGAPTQYNAIDPRTVKGVNLGALGGDTASNFGIDNSPTGDSGIKPGTTNYANGRAIASGGFNPSQFGYQGQQGGFGSHQNGGYGAGFPGGGALGGALGNMGDPSQFGGFGGGVPGQSGPYGGINPGGGNPPAAQSQNPNIPPALQQLIDQAQANQTRQQDQRTQLNQVLMGQLGALGTPVSANDATLKPMLDQGRLSSQREADKARALAAERRSAQGLGDSGAMETDIRGIDEQRAENNLANESSVLYNEMNNRRNSLQNLLGMAVGSNDAQAAQLAATQLGAIGQQMQGNQFGQSLANNQNQFGQNLAFNYAGLGQNNNQFNAAQQNAMNQFFAGLNQNQGQFQDSMGLNWAQLQQSGNLQALMALLGVL